MLDFAAITLLIASALLSAAAIAAFAWSVATARVAAAVCYRRRHTGTVGGRSGWRLQYAENMGIRVHLWCLWL